MADSILTIIERLGKWAGSDPLCPRTELGAWDWADVIALINSHKRQAKQVDAAKEVADAINDWLVSGGGVHTHIFIKHTLFRASLEVPYA